MTRLKPSEFNFWQKSPNGSQRTVKQSGVLSGSINRVRTSEREMSDFLGCTSSEQLFKYYTVTYDYVKAYSDLKSVQSDHDYYYHG